MEKYFGNRISKKQLQIINKYIGTFPIKIGKLANELNVSVKVSAMDMSISGQIKLEGNQCVIRVNRYEARERQRFTIAHELAHFLLHRDYIVHAQHKGITDNVLYRSGMPEKIEFEANQLAAEIIMPMNLIDKRLKELGGVISEYVIERLARDFQVSKAAMEIRLSNLSNS